MPLFTMSANIQMPEAAARKRNHDEYAEDSVVLPVDKDVPGTGLENGAVPSTTDTPMVAVEAPATRKHSGSCQHPDPSTWTD